MKQGYSTAGDNMRHADKNKLISYKSKSIQRSYLQERFYSTTMLVHFSSYQERVACGGICVSLSFG